MNHEESKLQSLIVKYLQDIGVFCFSCPNELAGGNAARRMSAFISMGLRPGISDLIVWYRKHTIYMEVKTPTGKMSKSQMKFQKRCEQSGRTYCVVRSLDDVRAVLESFN